MRFEELSVMRVGAEEAAPLDDRILRAVKEMGFEEMSPIQAKAIPAVMEGRDIIGQAQTGTGKTAAFGIPMLETVEMKDKAVQAIVLCPTRELAIQVADEIRNLAKFMHGVKVLPIYGGQEIVKQIKSLKTGVQIVVGTPGRVMDHMRRKTVKFGGVRMVVLDEADEMLNMGFREDIETILEGVPTERQTVLFSATMPKPIVEIAKKHQKNAETIKVVRKELTVENIEQFYFDVRPKNKDEVLARLIDVYNPQLSVIFCNTKRKVDELTEMLKGRGYFAEGLHGDLVQKQRDRVMNSFRNGKTEILVATDVAARGIDVDDVDIVFNYDLPQDDEYYVHRIGRTGRAGKTGLALSFVSGKEVYKLKDIERFCKTKIKAKPIPSVNDIRNTKIDHAFQEVEAVIEEGHLTEMLNLVEQRVNEEDYTAMDIAAAFLKMYLGDDEIVARESTDADTGRGGRHRGADNDYGDTGAEEGMVRLFMNIGKKQGVRASNIVGAIAGESGIPGNLIGAIDMFDSYTFVEVPREYTKEVLQAMKNVKIKGKTIAIEPANRK